MVVSPSWPLRQVLPPSFFGVGDVTSGKQTPPRPYLHVIIRDVSTATRWFNFKSTYESARPGRTLVLLPHWGRAELQIQAVRGKCKVSCPTVVMLLLAAVLELQDTEQHYVPLEAVQQSTNIPQRLLDIAIQSATAEQSRLLERADHGIRINVGLQGRKLVVSLTRELANSKTGPGG
jgi:hypothetical protein